MKKGLVLILLLITVLSLIVGCQSETTSSSDSGDIVTKVIIQGTGEYTQHINKSFTKDEDIITIVQAYNHSERLMDPIEISRSNGPSPDLPGTISLRKPDYEMTFIFEDNSSSEHYLWSDDRNIDGEWIVVDKEDQDTGYVITHSYAVDLNLLIR